MSSTRSVTCLVPCRTYDEDAAETVEVEVITPSPPAPPQPQQPQGQQQQQQSDGASGDGIFEFACPICASTTFRMSSMPRK